jgi:hypothetical protein
MSLVATPERRHLDYPEGRSQACGRGAGRHKRGVGVSNGDSFMAEPDG